MSAEDAFLELVDRLDEENEFLRMRALDLTAWMEESVTAQVSWERRLSAVEAHARDLQAELDAIHRTLTWRLLAPVRRTYARLRAKIDSS